MYICNMRKYYVFAAAALVVLAACQKKGNETENENKGANLPLIAMPSWVSDESLPVPIEMGSPVLRTKGTPITDDTTPGNFNAPDFTYTVLALQTVVSGNNRVATTTVMPGFEGGMLARNVDGEADASIQNGGTGDDLTNFKVAQFGTLSGTSWTTKIMYYPYLYSAGTYNFYGYRINNTNTKPTLSGVTIPNVTLGENDIIWAKAEPIPALETYATNAYGAERGYDMNTSAGQDAAEANGFTAKYIRGARWAIATGQASGNAYTDFLPALDFGHITSQIQFMVKAYDQLAANTLKNANVKVQSIQVGGTTLAGTTAIYTNATLDVTTGEFDGTTQGLLTVSNIPNSFLVKYYDPNDPNASNPNFDADAACGDPLFIMPMTGDIMVTLNLTLPGLSEPQAITAKLSAPAIAEDLVNHRPAVAAGTFAAGYAYKFTISLMSLEKIQIITSIADWIDAPATEPIVID